MLIQVSLPLQKHTYILGSTEAPARAQVHGLTWEILPVGLYISVCFMRHGEGSQAEFLLFASLTFYPCLRGTFLWDLCSLSATYDSITFDEIRTHLWGMGFASLQFLAKILCSSQWLLPLFLQRNLPDFRACLELPHHWTWPVSCSGYRAFLLLSESSEVQYPFPWEACVPSQAGVSPSLGTWITFLLLK